jgi:hypothetical protein
MANRNFIAILAHRFGSLTCEIRSINSWYEVTHTTLQTFIPNSGHPCGSQEISLATNRSHYNKGTITARNGLLALIYMQYSFLHSRRDGPWIEIRGRILCMIVWSCYTPVNRPAYVTYRCQDSGQTHNKMRASNSWQNFEMFKYWERWQTKTAFTKRGIFATIQLRIFVFPPTI